MKPPHRTLVIGLLLAAALPMSSTMADVTLPAIISDHMVLQAETAAPIWGQAAPGEAVTVEIAGQKKSTKAGPDGRWQVRLDPLKPGTAATLTVQGKNTLTVNDVLVGEVWLCSGQSNMAYGVSHKDKDRPDFPEFRFFTETSPGHEEPAKTGAGQWQLCNEETMNAISGVAYYFGRSIHESQGRPVGVVVSAVNGSSIESWTAAEIQKDLPDMEPVFTEMNTKANSFNPDVARANYEKALAAYKERVAQLPPGTTNVPGGPAVPIHPFATGPGGLFNGKIAPLIPYAIRGILCYQGESNATTPEAGKLYAEKFAMMINDWRARWGQGDFPFAWVQLPRFKDEKFQGWRELRESQLKTLRLPNTGMVVTVDMNVDPSRMHPKNKKDVAKRLVAWALANVYGQNIPFSGPLPTGQEVKGSEIVCSFKYAEGMKPSDGELKGFMIAGADQKWFPANAKIAGDKVIVSSPDVSSPVAVRYSWDDVPDGNLVNASGLPASPFRSDDW